MWRARPGLGAGKGFLGVRGDRVVGSSRGGLGCERVAPPVLWDRGSWGGSPGPGRRRLPAEPQGGGGGEAVGAAGLEPLRGGSELGPSLQPGSPPLSSLFPAGSLPPPPPPPALPSPCPSGMPPVMSPQLITSPSSPSPVFHHPRPEPLPPWPMWGSEATRPTLNDAPSPLPRLLQGARPVPSAEEPAKGRRGEATHSKTHWWLQPGPHPRHPLPRSSPQLTGELLSVPPFAGAWEGRSREEGLHRPAPTGKVMPGVSGCQRKPDMR